MRRFAVAAPSVRGVGATDTREAVRGRRATRLFPRFDRLELLLLALFAAVSAWVLALDLWQVIANGRVWTGTDGVYVVDQLQYLSWIESASRHHLLVANLFVLHGTPADYFQPAIAISGLLTAAGLAPSLVLLLWKPVAVLAMFAAVRAFAWAVFPGAARGPRLAVIALTLFYGCFSDVYGHLGVVGDMFPGFLSWGYPFALLGTACMTFALLGYARARRSGRVAWGPALLGALASSLHPWQGELLILLILLTEATDARPWAVVRTALRAPDRRRGLVPLLGVAARSRRVRLAALTIGAALVPLVYYLALDRFDPSWGLGRNATKHGFSFLAIGLALLPLALVALLGYRGRAAGFLARGVRLWPLVILIVYWQSTTSGGSAPLHAFDGVTLPLSVLAVQGVLRAGWRRLPARRVLAVAVLLIACVPATLYEMKGARADVQPAVGNPNFITRDERAALDFLRHSPVRGGVFSRAYLGMAIPGRTGRHTYVGDCIWSQPNCNGRAELAREILADQLPARQIQQTLIASGARFILSDCQDNGDLTQALGPLLQSVHRFGCATVWQVTG